MCACVWNCKNGGQASLGSMYVTETKRKREGERERESVCVCVCVCVIARVFKSEKDKKSLVETYPHRSDVSGITTNWSARVAEPEKFVFITVYWPRSNSV